MADIAVYSDARVCFHENLVTPLVNANYATAARGPTTMTSAPVPYVRLTSLGVRMTTTFNHATAISMLQTDNPGFKMDHPGDEWFEKFHIIPRTLVFGNILTPTTTTLDLFSAFRRSTHFLTGFVNNAGAGTSITNLPTLPYTFPPLSGLLLSLLVTPDGPATINTTLDFEFDAETDQIPITGQRIVMFPFEPEAPLVEHLEFLTDILPHKDGTEQRVALRPAPRQSFDITLRRQDGVERASVDNLLFDWQARVFGLPLWVEPSFSTAAVSAGASSINVDDTSLGDFRVGGLCIVFQDESTFDALTIASLSGTVINFQTPLVNAYGVGTRVMPLRTCVTRRPAQEKRYANNLADIELTMCVIENGVSLADTSGWNVYNSRVLLDDGNIITESLSGVLDRNLRIFDGDTGKFSVASTWDRARRTSAKAFFCATRARLWSIRKLLHALGGRLKAFYLPTFSQELTLASTYISGSGTLTIVNVGYAKYAKQRQPRGDIRIVLTTGVTFIRTITASTDGGATESLTLSSSIAQNITPAQVQRIEYLEKVRLDTDDVVIQHNDANGNAEIGFPVKGVLE